MKIGIGYDIHRLVEERKLFLAGVEIPYIKGLLSYTDGDVVMHAVADAILGALALGDIGHHFPNNDPQYKDMPSSNILKTVVGMVSKNGFRITNVDIVIISEEPKIFPFRGKMTETLAAIMGLDAGLINIKATTNEGVGAIGRGDAIACYAVAMLAKC